ncbi:MAG: hypothetical protein E7231_08760 [Cellulosilyticum sp.]|nr:hypothetical protein [Cellulosilyticum sp.]
MKKKPIRISANEINRFTYCPYQWYYGRVYGQKALKEKYLAVERKEVPHEGNFKRGLKFHEKYYSSYRLRKRVEWLIILLFAVLLIWGIMQWSQL